MGMEQLNDDQRRYAEAVPLAAFTAEGLGPLRQPAGADFGRRLDAYARTDDGTITAIESAGSTGLRLIALVALYDGNLTEDRLAFETAFETASGTDGGAAEIETAVERLIDARLVRRSTSKTKSTLTLTDTAAEILAYRSPVRSLTDAQAITSDVLTVMCRRLGADPASNRKQDKIDAITDLFADPDRAAAARKQLSARADKLLDRIADVDGLFGASAEEVGLTPYRLRSAEPSRYASSHPTIGDPDTAALAELTNAGFVGLNPWEGELWIWREAWPALGRPIYTDWPTVDRPAIVDRTEQPPRLPAIIAQFDRALSLWSANPPKVLKNNEQRLGKAEVKALAKTLDTTETGADIISRLAIATGLILPNEVSRSGRGRNQRVDHAWMVTPDVEATWRPLTPTAKWANLLYYYTHPSGVWGNQLLINRLFVLWELGALAPGTAYADDKTFSDWIDHRHATIGLAPAVTEALAELRALGVVEPGDQPALTRLGRQAVNNLDAVNTADLGRSEQAIVQADLTVTAPPDLDPGLLVTLATIATLESDAGAFVYRLDEKAIAAAAQEGETADSIVTFLTELSSVPLDDVIATFVADSVARAAKLSIINAPSVLVATDPVELATAVAYKSAKLTPITPTVAVSTLTPEKLRTALDRRGLSPQIIGSTGDAPAPRKAADRADQLEANAERYRRLAEIGAPASVRLAADRMMAEAAAARDTSKRWQPRPRFALAPVER